MILLAAVLGGALSGWGSARWQGRIWHPVHFHFLWLVFLAFLPQWVAFYLPATRAWVSDELASIALVSSQILLMIFVWQNLRVPGMSVLMVGLGCNLAVILANGGFMPLAVETLTRYVDQDVMNRLVIGGRIGKASKDILLPESQIVLPWLADRFVTPRLPFARTVFSLGDVFVAVGAFWSLVKDRSTAPLSDSGVSI